MEYIEIKHIVPEYYVVNAVNVVYAQCIYNVYTAEHTYVYIQCTTYIVHCIGIYVIICKRYLGCQSSLRGNL